MKSLPRGNLVRDYLDRFASDFLDVERSTLLRFTCLAELVATNNQPFWNFLN